MSTWEEIDREIGRILAMSDEEIIAETVARGEDPEMIAALMRLLTAKAISDANKAA